MRPEQKSLRESKQQNWINIHKSLPLKAIFGAHYFKTHRNIIKVGPYSAVTYKINELGLEPPTETTNTD